MNLQNQAYFRVAENTENADGPEFKGNESHFPGVGVKGWIAVISALGGQ